MKRMHALFVRTAALLLAATTARADWTEWVPLGTLGTGTTLTIPCDWNGPRGGSDRFTEDISIRDFRTAYPEATGNWCIEFSGHLATGPGTGHPEFRRNSSGPDSNVATVDFEARIQTKDLNLRDGSRPAQIEVRLTSGQHVVNVSSVQWRDVEITHDRAARPGSLVVFRPCFDAPTPRPLVEWRGDGSNIHCPTHVSIGTNTFLFTASAQWIETPVGSGSGTAASSTVDASLVTGPTGVSVEIVLDGVPVGSRAGLFLARDLWVPPLQMPWEGVLLDLSLGTYQHHLRDFTIGSDGRAVAGPYDVPPKLDDTQFFVQWIVYPDEVNRQAGTSAALGMKLDLE